MSAFLDRCIWYATSTGTASFVEASAVVGYQTMESAGALDGQTFSYAAQTLDLSQWEVGTGSWTASSKTLTRTVIDNSSGGTSAINFSTIPQVLITGIKTDFRELLRANRTYFVRTDGSDSNGGFSNTASGAFLTIQKAMNVIAQTLDVAGFNVTIQLQASQTWTAGVLLTHWTGGGSVILDGGSGTLTTTSADAIATDGTAIPTFQIQNLAIGTTTSGNAIVHASPGYISLGNGITFNACAGGGIHMLNVGSGIINKVGTRSYTIAGGGGAHWYASGLCVTQMNGNAITLTGTPAFSTAFAVAGDGGILIVYSCTFTGSASVGTPRYNVSNNGVIDTGGAGTSYLPGGTAGSGTNPGTSPFGLYN